MPNEKLTVLPYLFVSFYPPLPPLRKNRWENRKMTSQNYRLDTYSNLKKCNLCNLRATKIGAEVKFCLKYQMIKIDVMKNKKSNLKKKNAKKISSG